MSEKRLYCCTVEVVYFAWAEDETVARGHFRDAVADYRGRDVDCDLATVPMLDSDWIDSIPWGSEDSRTCAELLGTSKEQIAADWRDRMATALHPKLPLEVGAA